MPDAISNTSPLLYLHQIDALHWLPGLFREIWIPTAVTKELAQGLGRGYDVPNRERYDWFQIVDPQATPS